MAGKTEKEILKDLISLSHGLGKPERGLAIIGEGNTSALLPDGTYYLKASGCELGIIEEGDFVRLKQGTVLALLKKGNVSEIELKALFEQAKTDSSQTCRPSIEALMHALCLSYEGVNFVGHTHPVHINRLTCSNSYPANLQGRMYPEEVLLGIDSVFVPYKDPGIPLALEIKGLIDAYIEKYESIPKSMYIQNHGFVALGSSAKETESITLTAEKAASIRLGAILAGGIRLLDPETVRHMLNRTDEKYRLELFAKK